MGNGDTVTASCACGLGCASTMRDERDRPPAGAMFAKSNDIFDRTPGLLLMQCWRNEQQLKILGIRLSVRP